MHFHMNQKKWIAAVKMAAAVISAGALAGCGSFSISIPANSGNRAVRTPTTSETVSAWNAVNEEGPSTADGSVRVEETVTAADEEDAFEIYGFPVGETEGLSGFAYDQESEDIKGVYRQLYTGVSKRESKFTLRAADSEHIKKALTALIIDHPEFFWIDGNASMSGFKTFGIWQIKLDFNVDPSEIDGIQAKIDAAADEYLSSLPEGATDYQKVKAAYEYIIRTTDYDLKSTQNQNIQSVFVNHLSVCAGYSRALEYLLHRAGVWCAYIEGTTGDNAEGHAWNLVKIDGTYTFVDPSWGDPTYGEDATDASRLSIIYDYLCLTSDELLRAKHIPGGQYSLPECTDSSYDYYRLNGLYYEGFDPDAISRALWHAVDEAERAVFMKFSDFESYTKAVDALFPPEGDEAESLLDAPIRQRMEWDSASSMRYYYSCSDELWIIKVYW